MKKNSFIILFLLLSTFTCQQLFAQGPPPPPPVAGVPFDGGIIAFLALALTGGISILNKKK
jgi:hypothetical protein